MVEKKKRESDDGEHRKGPTVRTGLIQGQTFGIKAVQYAEIDGVALFEGDIVLGSAEQMRAQTEELRAVQSGAVESGVVITGARFRWPNCVIPYDIDPALPSQARVTDAIAHWEARTRFRFVLRTAANAATYPDWVTFRPASGCSSSVGRQGGQQFINLGAGCTTGNTIHEIGHTVGLWHEQSREDRDTFVTIHWDKIQAGLEHNFNQHITDGDDVGTYDYGSIMHYPRDAFSVDGSDTITPVDATAAIGQRTGLSAGDVAAANSLCPRIPKRPIFDTRKESIKDLRLDTRKELIHDTMKEIPRDTRKELPFDTMKEMPRDTRKELPLDTMKEAAMDPPFGSLARPTPGRGDAVPFAVATPHHAADVDPRAQQEAVDEVTELDQRLEALAAAITETEAHRAMLQQQYDETFALLQQALNAHDPDGAK